MGKLRIGMNRELKFRVWDSEQVKFEFFELHNICVSDNLLCQHQYPVQQYTGLQDKDGKNIYEGDIVRFHKAIELSEDFFMSSLYLFDFYEGSFVKPQVYCSLNGSKYVKREASPSLCITGRAQISGNSFFDFNKAEVVGNIFENPELIDT
jgi:uncharacterized phage protein (TIGR01671 family)